MGQSRRDLRKRLLARRPADVALLAIVLLGLPGLFLVRGTGTEEGGGGTSVAMVLIIAAVALAGLVLVVLAAINVSSMLAGVDPEAPLIADRLADTPDQQRLLTRWLQRTRWTRNVGGFAGIVWWVIGTGTRGDLLLLVLGGVALGSMAAQLHQVRRLPGLRTASLDRRNVAQYARSSVRGRMAGVAACASLLAGTGLFYSSEEVGIGPALWGLFALTVLAIAAAIQTRVARRPRPALDGDLRYADDMARTLAIGNGLGEPATYWAVAIVGHGVDKLEPVIGGAATALSVLAWWYALGLWWRNRRLGLGHLLKEPLQRDQSPGGCSETNPTSDPASKHAPTGNSLPTRN